MATRFAKEIIKRLIDRIAQRTGLSDHIPDDVRKLIAMVKGYTVIHKVNLSILYGLAKEIKEKGIEGDIVECGVAKGGSSAILAYNFRNDPKRFLWLYDTFEGLPSPSSQDGPEAFKYTGECKGSIEEASSVISKIGFPLERVIFRKGLFKDTFKEKLPEKVALLHVDADWYESVLICLTTFYERISPGGIVILDDFGHWEGCRKAFYDFCKTMNVYPLLERVGHAQAFWRKGHEHNRDIIQYYEKFGIFWPFK